MAKQVGHPSPDERPMMPGRGPVALDTAFWYRRENGELAEAPLYGIREAQLRGEAIELVEPPDDRQLWRIVADWLDDNVSRERAARAADIAEDARRPPRQTPAEALSYARKPPQNFYGPGALSE